MAPQSKPHTHPKSSQLFTPWLSHERVMSATEEGMCWSPVHEWATWRGCFGHKYWCVCWVERGTTGLTNEQKERQSKRFINQTALTPSRLSKLPLAFTAHRAYVWENIARLVYIQICVPRHHLLMGSSGLESRYLWPNPTSHQLCDPG